MSLAILFHFSCAQHVSDITISIIRSLQLCCWITTSVVLFSVRCVLENKTTDVVIQQHSRKLLMMHILMSETCWAHKKWNKIASDTKLVFHSSTITMMLGPINVKWRKSVPTWEPEAKPFVCVWHWHLSRRNFASFQPTVISFRAIQRQNLKWHRFSAWQLNLCK